MANRARLCAGGENTPRKTAAGEAATEQGWEEESGCQSPCPPGLQTSVTPSRSSSASQPRRSRQRRMETSSRGAARTARGAMGAAVGPTLVVPECPRGTRHQGEAGGGLHQTPESSCLQTPNALEKARFGAGENNLTLFLLMGTTGMTGTALGCTTAAPSVEPSR